MDTSSSRFLLAIALLLAADPLLHGEQLPVRFFTTSESLAGDNVFSLLQDSRGFLWIGTRTGLSRFDGKIFRNYDADDGLPGEVVSDIVESRDGTLWFATSGGLARLRPGEQRIAPFPLGAPGEGVQVLLEDHFGTIWTSTADRRFAIETRGGNTHAREIHHPLPQAGDVWAIEALAEDPEGNLWIGTREGLLRRFPDGRMVLYRVRPREGHLAGDVPGFEIEDSVYHLLIDDRGRLWITHWGFVHGKTVNWGIYVLKPPWSEAQAPTLRRSLHEMARIADADEGVSRPLDLPDEPGEVLYLTGGKAFGDAQVSGVHQTRDGAFWFETARGVVRLERGFTQRFGKEQGLGEFIVHDIVEDRDGNVWLGTLDGGIARIPSGAFVTYDEDDGLSGRQIKAIFEDDANGLCVTGIDARGLFVARFDGRRFASFQPAGMEGISYWGWGWNQTALQDRAGELWVATGEGLLRYPRVESCAELARTAPRARYTERDGLPNDLIWRLFEDSRGDVWIAVEGADQPVTLWRRATESFEPISIGRIDGPTAFAEDTAGNVWVGFYDGGLARFGGGRLEHFGVDEGVPNGLIHDLHVDRGGRLWVATGVGGLARIDDPAASPRIAVYTTREGLSSNAVHAVTEDGEGRIYVGTSRGVDRLDPETDRVRRYSTAEGLAANTVYLAHTDSQGDLWFGTWYGVSRLRPGTEPRRRPPTVLIEALRIGGVPRPLSELGETSVAGLELEPDERRVQIDYAGVSLAAGEVLRYQTRLEGVEDDWSPPTEERSVLYGNLGSGSYQFLVRAVNAEGMTSQAASVAFTVLPPFWQRPWFLVPALCLAALGAFAAYRYRVRRLVAIERVRTEIATDLHDDLGARLSRVSILSEAASRLIGRDDAQARRLLGEMGETSRGLIDAAGDIAWSIDPHRDDVGSLVARIRRFASDTLDARGMAWSFETPPDGLERRLDPEQRRHLLLVFQEAIHNALRHAGASRVDLALRIADGRVEVEIRDDGRGFPAAAPPEDHAGGRGLLNMRERAKALGGRLNVDSEPGRGTRIRIRAPLAPSFRRHPLWRGSFKRGDRNA